MFVIWWKTGGPDLSMVEIDEAASIVAKTVAPDAEIIFGAVVDEKMVDNVKVIIIATRIKTSHTKKYPTISAAKTSRTDFSPSPNKESPDKKVTSLYEDEIESAPIDDETEFDIPAFLRKK